MMNALIVKILAVGLTLTQLFNKPPEEFIAQFDPVADQQQVSVILGEGCKFLISEFKSEKVDFDFLFTMMIGNIEKDREALKKATEEALAKGLPPPEKTVIQKVFEEIDLPSLHAGYKQFCLGQVVENSPIKLDEVIQFYNAALKDLPDHTMLKGKQLPQASILLDRNGNKFTEVYSDEGRRRWIKISELPSHVRDAFVAAEDKRFFQHNGLDIRGIIRAFSNNLMGSGRPEGGSTITQQVSKNLVVGDDVTFERKMREMVIARRVESLLSKEEILELYINFIFLGRASWGIEMAAQSYFGKSARQLAPHEAAFLAGLTKGPNYYHADFHADRALDRRQYVLGRLKDDGYITEEMYQSSVKEPVTIIPYDPPKTTGGFYFIDELNRRAKEVAGVPSLTSGTYKVHSTMHPEMQKATERALQDGLYNYEVNSGRSQWNGPSGSIARQIDESKKTWQEILPNARSKQFDSQWPLAAVVEKKNGRVTVGLKDGRTARLSGSKTALNSLEIYDLVHVNVIEGKEAPKAELRVPAIVQGAALVIENKTGRVIAMSGGFSFAQSQLNRVTQTYRQTGSTLKPFIYLAALGTGYFQPNTLIPDTRPTLPPLRSGQKSWTPKNYDGRAGGYVTLRRAVERSRNLPTIRVMASLGATPGEGLDYVRSVTQKLGIYQKTERYYSFVLGAQPARLIDLAYAYAAIANSGDRPKPHFIDMIEQDGKMIYERPRFEYAPPSNIDRVAFYQMRRILEGTLVRGTASAMKDLAGKVAGKTGTSNDENDAWFIGFTNDITVAVWVGYDNRNIRPSLGSGFTGGTTALPIARAIFDKSFELYKQPEPFADAPEDVKPLIQEVGIDVRNGQIGGKFIEYFRLNSPVGTGSVRLPTNEPGLDDDQIGIDTDGDDQGFEESPDLTNEDQMLFDHDIVDDEEDLF